MAVLQLWIWLLMLLVRTVVLAETLDLDDPNIRSVVLRTHGLSAPYLDSDMQSRWWDFGGDTVIRTDKYVRLTGEFGSRNGWIFSRVPLTATNWEIEVEFKIHGAANLYGDGMAMWLTKQRGQEGPVFGMADQFEGLGIFIDTYKNNRPGTVFPYVMAMVGDGETKYDKAADGKANELAGCSARGVRNQNIPTKLRLTYYQDKTLTLDLQYETEGTWKNCFSVAAPKLPNVAYLGFSAETGELSDNHDLIAVSTKNIYAGRSGTRAGDQKFTPGGGRGRKSGSGGGWGWFFLKFLLFGLGVTGAYVGLTMYRASSQRSRF